jgi:hypothetical protein
MTILVSVDCVRALLRRWESGGARPRLTHLVRLVEPLPSLAPALIAEFLLNPDVGDYCGPPVVPPRPPSVTPPAARAHAA